ncbi:MAG: hypothetical protein ACM3PY_04510 [Omnitrophica WOR_2 bacterium]
MKKVILGLVIVAVLAAGLSVAGLAYAQSATPQTPGSGYGMMNGRGQRGGMMAGNTTGTQSGFLHDEMIAAWAAKLNLTVDEINTRLAKGETMSQIAYSTGITTDQFRTLMLEVRSTAIDQAVKDGKLTQAQADWMKTRGAGAMAGGAGRGMGGNGRFSNPACPYYNQANP